MTKLIKTRVEIEGRVTEEWALIDESDTTEAWDVEAELQVVGHPHPRVDGPQRVTGGARFTHDLQFPGMLHGVFLRSPLPHARVREIDTQAAEALPGVHVIYTHKNAPAWNWRAGAKLLDPVVRYQGDEVAFVVAESRRIAKQACKLIRVDYEPLPFVLDPLEAIQPEAPLVRGGQSNVIGDKPDEYTRGDVAAGFAAADVVIEHTYHTPTALHSALETHGSVAYWEGARLVVHESTQSVANVRGRLADLFGLPRHQVRVIKEYMGGGFGAKSGTGKYTVLAAYAARALGRPVRALLDRQEESLATGNRSASVQHVKLGARRDGVLTAIEHTAWSAIGAFGGWAPEVCGPAKTLYRCAHVHTLNYGVLTNTGTFAAFRAPGYVEGIFALESALDELAVALGLDPLDVRLRNYTERDQTRDLPYSTQGLRDAWQKGAAHVNWASVRAAAPATGAVKRGWGMASQIWGGSGGPPAYALARLLNDGTVLVQTASQDIGTGTRTVLAQIAAEELGLTLERVSVELGDTHVGPYAPPSWGSTTVASVGPAVRSACAALRRDLLALAAQRHAFSGALTLVAGRICAADGSFPPPTGGGVTVADLLEEFGDIELVGHGARGPNAENFAADTFGAQFVEVEVDSETGAVRVLRVVAVHDCGRIINPLTASSQVEGGVLQAIGFALCEQRIVDPRTGVVLSDDFETYRIPTMLDTPVIETVFLNYADRAANTLGAKGVGEPPIIPTAAAIANAVYHATGLRVRALPLTRDNILDAFERAGQP